MNADEIDRRFMHHPPDRDREQRHLAIRGLYLRLAHDVLPELPEGREKALAATALEESLFWANAAIAREGR